MNLNDLFANSLYFGMILSLFSFFIGYQIKKKWNYPLFNPLLLSIIIIIITLLLTGISFETYQYGAKYLTYFLTPVTVCLAVPLYKQLQVLKQNIEAVIIGILIGCIVHAGVILLILKLWGTDIKLILSLLPKSITTAIALGVSDEIGGIQAVTVIGVTIAGLSGAIIGPTILKIFHIKEPVAQGLAIGSASHAVGTSKAVELGEVQAAMSSLAIVVTGLLTVIIVPVIAHFM